MRKLLFFAFLVFLFSCKNGKNNDLMLPDWKVGDYKRLYVESNAYSTNGQEKILDMKANNSYDLNVVDKDSDGYILEILNTSKLNLEASTSYAEVDETLQMLQKLIDNIGKLSIPYKVRINNSGRVEDIIDFENVLMQFEEKVFELADSISLSDIEIDVLAGMVAERPTFSESIRFELTRNIIDLFEIYNKPLPFDTIIEQISEPDPNTGRYVNLTVKYFVLSENDGKYKIKANILWDKSAFESNQEFVDGFFNEKSKSSNSSKVEIENYALYEWNSNTSWFESMKHVLEMQIDTVYFYAENNLTLE